MAKEVVVSITAATFLFALVALFFSHDGTTNVDVIQESQNEKPHSSIGLGTEGHKADLSFQVEHQTWSDLPASIQAKRDIPRMDFRFKTVSKTFCGGANYTSKQKCSEPYKESLVMTALPLMIVALLTLLIFIVVMIGRNCIWWGGPPDSDRRNGCCGGKVPSQGLCFGPPLPRDEGYTPYRRKLYIFLLVAILILVGVAMAVGFTGNTQLSDGINALLDLTQTIPAKVRRQIVYIDAELNSLKSLSEQVNPGTSVSLWSTAIKALLEVDKSVKTLQQDASSAYDKIKKNEQTRKEFFKWAFIATPIIAIVGLGGYFLPSLITLVVVPCVFICTVLCWLTIGVHIPVSVATADFCVDLDYSLKHPNASMGAIDMILKCGGKAATADIIKTSDSFIADSNTKACSTLTNQLCNMPNVTYPGPHGHTNVLRPVQCPAKKCDKSTLKDFMNHTIVADFQWGCAKLVNGSIATVDCKFTNKDTAKKQCLAKYGNSDVLPCTPEGKTYRGVKLKECAKNCYMNNTKTFSATTYGNFELLQRFTHLQDRHLKPLLGCEIIRKGVVSLEHTLCWEVVNATDYIIAGLAIIGITFFLGMGIYLGAQKIFNRKYWEEFYKKHYDETYPDAAGSVPLLGGGDKNLA